MKINMNGNLVEIGNFILSEPCKGATHGPELHRSYTDKPVAFCDFTGAAWVIPECGDAPAPCNCDDPTTHNGHTKFKLSDYLDLDNESECKHENGTRKRFGGALTCVDCSRIVGYWSAGQEKISMKVIDAYLADESEGTHG